MVLPIATFLLISFLIGMHASGRIAGKVRNFYVAGNIIPAWVLAISMTGQAIELGGTYDNATFALKDGFWAGAVLPIGIGLSLIFIGLFFAEPLHKMKLLTLPDFYFRRYDKRVEFLVSILSVASFIILIAGNLAGVGIILHFLIGINPTLGMTIVAIPVMIYTMAGGLFAVTWNDVLHVGVLLIGFVSATGWFLATHDLSILNEVCETKFSWTPLTSIDGGALNTWASLLALAFGDIVALDFMERVFAAKSGRGARRSCLLAGLITISIGVMLAFLGMMASITIMDHEVDGVFLVFIRDNMPQGIAMMVFMGFIAACISTIDGAIMACSVVITKNIVQQQFPKLIPNERLLLFSRLCAIPVTVFSIIVAIIRPVPGDLLVLAFDVVFAGCLVPLALGIYWKHSTARAAFWSMLIASGLRIVFYLLHDELGLSQQYLGLTTLIPPVVSLLIFISISLIDSRKNSKGAALHANP